MPDEHELNIVLLEDRVPDGWEGVAQIKCPHCGLQHVVRVFTTYGGRAVSFYDPPPGDIYRVDRQTLKP